MFEYSYCIDLVIVHPNYDPGIITARLATLSPTVASRAGEYKKDVRGNVLPRRARQSVWAAPLHEGNRLFSGVVPISECLRNALTRLRPYAEFLEELSTSGEVIIDIGWFSTDSHASDVLDRDVIELCAALHVSVELNFVAPGHVQ